jgi:hypothetical protein
MSGMAATEDRLQDGAVSVRIGEGRTAEVLRNLCFQIQSEGDQANWNALVLQIKNLFGVTLNPPPFIKETRSVLLLDEPDAHLEILRQRQICQILTETADKQGCQVIAASHSEVLLSEAADRDIVVAFVGRKPHRTDDRGAQVLKSLRAIGFDRYYQAEQRGWVLYAEGSTDLAILQAFAKLLDHRAQEVLEQPFVHYVANQPNKARDHFRGLMEAKPDIAGIAISDSIPQVLDENGALCELKRRQREIENYLCFPETLLAYAEHVDGEPGPLFEPDIRNRQRRAMQEAIDEVVAALRTLGKPDPFGSEVKASDEFLGPVFQKYFEKLGTRNLMLKTGYHILAHLVPRDRIDPEIGEKLDHIVEIAARAWPVT